MKGNFLMISKTTPYPKKKPFQKSVQRDRIYCNLNKLLLKLNVSFEVIIKMQRKAGSQNRNLTSKRILKNNIKEQKIMKKA